MGRSARKSQHAGKNETIHSGKKTESNGKENSYSKLLYPNGENAMRALTIARFCSIMWSHISDCDETYNYWEPSHYLLFGNGLQTWEYSPQFALRSYNYLLVHIAPALAIKTFFQPSPLFLFYATRFVIGFSCALAEVYFYKSICREFGVHIGRICLIFQMFSAGMFISSSAYLPSSFAMITFTGACAAWWSQKYPLTIFLIALGSLLGWPFAALLGLPIACDLLFLRRSYGMFIKWSAISFLVIMVPTVMIDSYQYGRLVIAPWNIIRYNIFGGAGPNLYGTEPFSFYFINGFLNFNFIWVLALICPILLLISYWTIPSKRKSTLNLPHYISLSPLFLWMCVFLLQPHKEERFLFPVYPMICLTGAVAVDLMQKLIFRVWSLCKPFTHNVHYLDKTGFIMIIVLLLTSFLGMSRIFSLYRNYHAPLDLLIELNKLPSISKIPPNATVNFCLAKDWHRYPSSFFLPSSNWHVRFVRSEFNGLLPAQFSKDAFATRIIPPHFNDQNKAEEVLYFNIKLCHFLLDLDLDRSTDLEPVYARNSSRWKVVSKLPFLDSERSNSILRAFFIPFYSDKYLKFGTMYLLQTLKTNKILQ